MNLRGLVTSLGAGGSLIAAALCALVVVGGILAVGGATGGSARAESGDMVVPGGIAPALAAGEPRVAVRAALGVDRPRATTRRRTVARQRGVAGRPQRSAPRLTPSAPPTTSSSTPEAPVTTDSSPADSSSATPSPPPPPQANETGTVRRVVQQTGEAVAPVLDAAPEPAQLVVDEVVDTVEQVADTVDETLAPVTGLLPSRRDELRLGRGGWGSRAAAERSPCRPQTDKPIARPPSDGFVPSTGTK